MKLTEELTKDLADVLLKHEVPPREAFHFMFTHALILLDIMSQGMLSTEDKKELISAMADEFYDFIKKNGEPETDTYHY